MLGRSLFRPGCRRLCIVLPVVTTLLGAPFASAQITHTADVNADMTVSLAELLRVIQFFSVEGLHCAEGPAATEDGFVAGAGTDHTCMPHDSDYDEQDWIISFSELLRLIQLYNNGPVTYCPAYGSEDSFIFGAQICPSEGEGGGEGDGEAATEGEGGGEGGHEGEGEGEGEGELVTGQWIRATSEAGWAGRYHHGMTVHDGKLWVMGGNGPGSL